jgi:hypothetical protein
MSTKRNIISNVSLSVPVSIAEQSKAWTVYDCFNIEIASLNPARGMDVCLRVSVLSCVLVEALCWTDPPTKESYQMSVDQEVHSGRPRSNKDCRSQWTKKNSGEEYKL